MKLYFAQVHFIVSKTFAICQLQAYVRRIAYMI